MTADICYTRSKTREGDDTSCANMEARHDEQSSDTSSYGRKSEYRHKHWLECFSVKRDPSEKKLVKECTKALSIAWSQYGNPDSPLDMLLDFEDPVAACDKEKVQDHYAKEEVLRVSEREVKSRAMIYEIDRLSGSIPMPSEWSDATRLQELMRERRSNIRLIYLYRPDRAYISAIATTVSENEAHALKDVVVQHHTRTPILQVYIPAHGYPTFRLEFHMPYLMRKSATYVVACGESYMQAAAQRPWYNLAFLDPNAEVESSDVLREACISFTLTGTHNGRWTSYTIADTGREVELFDESDDGDSFVDGDGNIPTEDEIVPTEDEIVPTEDEIVPTEDFNFADGVLKTLTDTPTKDPRSYFLLIVCSRLLLILNEWACIVDTSTKGLDAWVKRNHMMISSLEVQDRIDFQKGFAWILHAARFLDNLSHHIGRNLTSLDTFFAADGDVCYFQQMGHYEDRLLDSLASRHQRLRDQHERINTLATRCESLTATLKISMNIYNMKLHDRNIGLTEKDIGLAEKNIILTGRTIGLAEKSNQLIYETNGLSAKIQELNSMSTTTAIATNKSAIDTAKITNRNLQLFAITCPFVLVLQWFGSNENFFPFERNTKTFWISIVVVAITLSVLLYVATYAIMIPEYIKKSCVHLTKPRRGHEASSSVELAPVSV